MTIFFWSNATVQILKCFWNYFLFKIMKKIKNSKWILFWDYRKNQSLMPPSSFAIPLGSQNLLSLNTQFSSKISKLKIYRHILFLEKHTQTTIYGIATQPWSTINNMRLNYKVWHNSQNKTHHASSFTNCLELSFIASRQNSFKV